MRTTRRAMNRGSSPASNIRARSVERSVGIGAAHALVQGRDQVVAAVLRLVVDRARRCTTSTRRAASSVSPGGRRARFLGERQHRPSVAVEAIPSAPSRARGSSGSGFRRQTLGADEQRFERLGPERTKDSTRARDSSEALS